MTPSTMKRSSNSENPCWEAGAIIGSVAVAISARRDFTIRCEKKKRRSQYRTAERQGTSGPSKGRQAVRAWRKQKVKSGAIKDKEEDQKAEVEKPAEESRKAKKRRAKK